MLKNTVCVRLPANYNSWCFIRYVRYFPGIGLRMFSLDYCSRSGRRAKNRPLHTYCRSTRSGLQQWLLQYYRQRMNPEETFPVYECPVVVAAVRYVYGCDAPTYLKALKSPTQDVFWRWNIWNAAAHYTVSCSSPLVVIHRGDVAVLYPIRTNKSRDISPRRLFMELAKAMLLLHLQTVDSRSSPVTGTS